jgi:hypothetical protein
MLVYVFVYPPAEKDALWAKFFTAERHDHARHSNGATAIAGFISGARAALRDQREDREEVAAPSNGRGRADGSEAAAKLRHLGHRGGCDRRLARAGPLDDVFEHRLTKSHRPWTNAQAEGRVQTHRPRHNPRWMKVSGRSDKNRICPDRVAE